MTLPRKKIQVMLLIPVSLGKDIEKTVTVDPRDSAEVTLLFTFKFNPKILLPFGAFTQPQSSIETEIIYGPAVGGASSAAAASAAYSAAPAGGAAEGPAPSAAPGEKKFPRLPSSVKGVAISSDNNKGIEGVAQQPSLSTPLWDS